ncbi:hypothetical protein PFLA_b1197 [Pseudoalteromonas flavipulchra NCIMB 2033 = ATCC BAA-314]|nr:hypothetical protein [Pseudoalteromonas flavipulchra NCIMB 2033 = ATCC BAA-314]
MDEQAKVGIAVGAIRYRQKIYNNFANLMNFYSNLFVRVSYR